MQRRFLIVDDDEQSRYFLERLLSVYFADGEVRTATNGNEGLERLAAWPADLVILDAMMPGLDGFAVSRRIKADASGTAPMVLMVSGVLVDPRDRVSGLESGADSYLCRPFDTAEFVAQVNALLRIADAERALREGKAQLERELVIRRETERQLHTARDAAEAAARSRSEFLAHMSHELRTPMNAVIGLTDILLDTTLDADQRDLLETIRSSGESLLAIINDILNFSKIESGRTELEHEVVDVAAVVHSAMDMVRVQADRKGLRVALEIVPGAPARFSGDRLRVRQILSNLLSNAVKFTAQGDIRVLVDATQDQAGGPALRFAVSDTGIGIPQERMGRLFQPFTQVDASTTRQYGGTGLGLVISRKLTELMGGQMWLESKEGRGSTFFFTLPLSAGTHHGAATVPGDAPVPLPAPDPDAAATPPGEATATGDAPVPVPLPLPAPAATPPDAPPRPLRILVAEDNPVNQKVIVRLLGKLGYTPVVVSNGREAAARALAEPFDLVLMDLLMPEVDGLDATRRIREGHPPGGRQPWIIALTASALEEDRTRCVAAGMDEFLTKPLREHELRTALDACVHGARP